MKLEWKEVCKGEFYLFKDNVPIARILDLEAAYWVGQPGGKNTLGYRWDCRCFVEQTPGRCGSFVETLEEIKKLVEQDCRDYGLL